jgi:ankyrin repeat protein
LLLDKGAKVDPADWKGDTPLHWAAGKGHVDTVALLLERGAKPGTANKSGSTALDLAKLHGMVDVQRLLRA